MKISLCFFHLIVMLYSCNSSTFKANSSNEIVLIIEQAPEQGNFVTPGGIRFSSGKLVLLSYIDGDSVKGYYPVKVPDTLHIPCTQSFIEVAFNYKSAEDYYTLFQRSDTISVFFDSLSYPSFRSRASPALTSAYGFTLGIKNRRAYMGLEPLTMLSQMGRYFRKTDELMNMKPLPPSLKELKGRRQADYIPMDSLHSAFCRYTKSYKQSLDSLTANPAIPYAYQYYYNYLLQLKHWQYYMSNYSYDKDIPADTSIKQFFADSLTNYPSYRSFVRSYVVNFENFYRKIPVIKYGNNGGGGSSSDWRVSFDTITHEKGIPPKTKQLMLYFCLEKVIESFTVDDIRRYIVKYEIITGDTTGIKRLTNANKLDFSTSQELQLFNENGEEVAFKGLLEKYKGRVVYVDFWASWCGPCLRSMPEAKRLREEYKGKSVVFVYLAMNDDEEAWKKAARKLDVGYLSESFFIANAKTSQMLVDLDVKTIPRYLLYGKNGELVHRNAPGPEGREIRDVLNKYLAE